MSKFIFVHLYNDRSGSPKVLSQVINATCRRGYSSELLTSYNPDGVLNDLSVNPHNVFYKRSENKIITLVYYLISQFLLFLSCLRYFRQDVVFYVNTLMPFGAAVAAWIMRKPVIYHIHETSIKPKILKSFLRFIVNLTATKIIFVSDFLKNEESFFNKKQFVVYNAIDVGNVLIPPEKKDDKFNILMACSLKTYKGILEYISIAKHFVENKGFDFYLVLNADSKEINAWFNDVSVPPNIKIFSRQTDMTSFYAKSHLLLNLSRPDECIETFGLTILEGMSFGLPVIVPPVGGPVEIVENECEGYLISCYETQRIVDSIKKMAADSELYNYFSNNAIAKAKFFSLSEFEKNIIDIIDL